MWAVVNKLTFQLLQTVVVVAAVVVVALLLTAALTTIPQPVALKQPLPDQFSVTTNFRNKKCEALVSSSPFAISAMHTASSGANHS